MEKNLVKAPRAEYNAVGYIAKFETSDIDRFLIIKTVGPNTEGNVVRISYSVVRGMLRRGDLVRNLGLKENGEVAFVNGTRQRYLRTNGKGNMGENSDMAVILNALTDKSGEVLGYTVISAEKGTKILKTADVIKLADAGKVSNAKVVRRDGTEAFVSAIEGETPKFDIRQVGEKGKQPEKSPGEAEKYLEVNMAIRATNYLGKSETMVCLYVSNNGDKGAVLGNKVIHEEIADIYDKYPSLRNTVMHMLSLSRGGGYSNAYIITRANNKEVLREFEKMGIKEIVGHSTIPILVGGVNGEMEIHVKERKAKYQFDTTVGLKEKEVKRLEEDILNLML